MKKNKSLNILSIIGLTVLIILFNSEVYAGNVKLNLDNKEIVIPNDMERPM